MPQAIFLNVIKFLFFSCLVSPNECQWDRVELYNAQGKILQHTHTHTHTHRCGEALEMNKHLITEEQHDYQRELQRKFRDFRDKMEPMVPTKKKHKRSRYISGRNSLGHGGGGGIP